LTDTTTKPTSGPLNVPEEQLPNEENIKSKASETPIEVTWDGDADPKNPRNWPKWKKW
jgi:hypothetical protein